MVLFPDTGIFVSKGRNTCNNVCEKKQINHKNQKNPVPKGTLDSSLKKTNKPEISNSFFQRIISLLKKEELI